MKVAFGKPFPAIDSVSLRDGVASGLVNGFINELDDYEKIPGLTLFGTHADAKAIDGLYETLNGVLLGVTNGKVVRIDSSGVFTTFTGDTITSGAYCYWAEDGQHVYLAHGGKLARLDLTNNVCTLLNSNSPSDITHVVRSKGFLLCNGTDVVIGSSIFSRSEVFDDSSSFFMLVTLTDQPGYIVMAGQRSSPSFQARIYRSTDNGATWSRVYTSDSVNYCTGLCYMGSGVVLAGTSNTGRVLRSTDYGANWSDLGQLGSATVCRFIYKSAASTALASTNTGGASGAKIFRSTNNGLTWAAISTPANFGTFVGEVCDFGGGVMCVPAMNNSSVFHIWRSTDFGVSWTDIFTGPSGQSPFASLAVSSTVGLIVYENTDGTSSIYRTSNAGVSWTAIGTITGKNTYSIPSEFLLTSDGQLLMATRGDSNLAHGSATQIWKSLDQGVSWSLVSTLDAHQYSSCWNMAESHSGSVLAVGNAIVSGASTPPALQDYRAAKWQTGKTGEVSLGPKGDVFYSEDFPNNYQAVDSWERFNAESVPDACNGVFENRSLVYAGGPRSIEINYSSGDAEFPWQVSDPSLAFGVLAPYSWVAWKELDTVMYLSGTDNVIEVVKFQGRSQQSISHEYAAILNDRTQITSPSTAKAWGVVIRGIPHYVLTFPADNLTICYNLVKNHWWRWAYWNGFSYEASLCNAYVYSKALNKHIVGDRRANGKIYTIEGLTDGGEALRFELTSGNISGGSLFPKAVDRMLFRVKRGQATDSSEPVFTWQARDNGNANFGTARSVSLGLTNDNEFLGYLNRGGTYFSRQHRIVHLDTKSSFIFSELDET